MAAAGSSSVVASALLSVDGAAQLRGPAARVCLVCARAAARYSCPRCNVPYCSVPCYRGHGGSACAEGFAAEQVAGVLAAERSERGRGGGRREVEAAIARSELGRDTGWAAGHRGGGDDEGRSDDDDGGSAEDDEDGEDVGGLEDDEAAAAEVAAGGVEGLPPSLREAFLAAVRDGSAAAAVPVWVPWWRPGGALAHPPLVVEAGVPRAASAPPCARDGGACPPVAPLRSLRAAPPSPALVYSVADVVYGYAHTMRLYNGDLEGEGAAAEVAAALLGASGALAEDRRYGGCGEVAAACVERALRGEVRGSAGAAFAVEVLDDAAVIMGDGHLLLDALLHTREIAALGTGTAVARNAARKIDFFVAWAADAGSDGERTASCAVLAAGLGEFAAAQHAARGTSAH